MSAAGFAAVLVGLGACGGGGGGADEMPPPGEGGAGGGSTLSQRPAPAVGLYDDSVVHSISLQMSADDWQSIIDDSRGDDWRPATVTYDGVVVDGVGIRPAGESSRFPGNVKQSFRIKFDAINNSGRFGGYSDVNVKGEFDDGSMMRERLAEFVFGKLMPAPKMAHARVVVNGDLRGLYTLREEWDSTSIGEHFTEPFGPLYRLRPLLHTDDPYKYLNDDPSSYVPVPWERHITTAARGDEVIAPFLQAVAAHPAPLDTVADVDDLLAYLAGSAIAMLTDGFVGSSGVSDHFQYFDPQSGRFFILPWDPDNSFASQGETPDRSIYDKFGDNALASLVQSQDDLRQRFKQKLADAMAAVPPDVLQAQADAIYAQIKDTAYEDPIKMFPNPTFDWNLGFIKDFITARYANLQDQIANGP